MGEKLLFSARSHYLFIGVSAFWLKKHKVNAKLFHPLHTLISCCLVSLCSVLQSSPLPGFFPPAEGDASCQYYPRYSEKFSPARPWGQAFLSPGTHISKYWLNQSSVPPGMRYHLHREEVNPGYCSVKRLLHKNGT